MRLSLVLLLAGCGPSVLLRPVAQPMPIDAVDLLVLSDLQYNLPFKTMFVGKAQSGWTPDEQKKNVPTSYRHAAASWFIPGALAWTIEEAEAAGIHYGVIAGDLAEFGCRREAEAVFGVLRQHPGVRFVIALGNHDVLPHGAYAPFAYRRLWRDTCGSDRDLLTKGAMIDLVLSYYRFAWKLPIPPDPSPPIWRRGRPDGPPPPAIEVAAIDGSDVLLQIAWRSTHDPKNCDDAALCSHQESYLFQRFQIQQAGGAATITVLDSMDFGSRSANSDTFAGRTWHVGVAGKVSAAQVAWLEKLPRGRGDQLLVSHYPPVENAGWTRGARVADNDVTELAFASGLERWLASPAGPAAIAYGHLHAPFAEGTLELPRARAIPIVQLPSLIDNKSYAWLRGGRFAKRNLPSGSGNFFQRSPTLNDPCAARADELAQIIAAIRLSARDRCPGPQWHLIAQDARRACSSPDWARQLDERARRELDRCLPDGQSLFSAQVVGTIPSW